MKSVVIALLLTGCGPNLSRLATEHHYREAVCAAQDGDASAKALVGAAIDRDAEVRTHVQLVDAGDLAARIPAALRARAGAATERVRFVRIDVQTNALPVDNVDADLDLRGTDRDRAREVSWRAIARLSAETLPGPVWRDTYATWANFGRTFAAMMTAGSSLLFPPMRFERGSRLVNPGDDDYERAAPVAHALHHALPESCDNRDDRDGTRGVACRWFVMVPRTALDVTAAVTVRFVASRRDRDGRVLDVPSRDSDHDPRAPCAITRRYTVDLRELAR